MHTFADSLRQETAQSRSEAPPDGTNWDPTHTKRVDNYQGMIVTLKARDDINAVDDLRGKRMGCRTLSRPLISAHFERRY
jgi:hypothetical protein